jgi:hypothetical protein
MTLYLFREFLIPGEGTKSGGGITPARVQRVIEQFLQSNTMP